MLNRAGLAALLLYAALGLAYLVWKSAFNSDPEVDLKYIWVAGRLWAEGINPYSDAFATIGDQFFDDTNTLDSWLYPPNWWVVSRALFLFDVDTAVIIWRSVNAMLVCAGAVLLAQAFSVYLGMRLMIATAFLLGYSATMQATPQVLSIGQTSIMLYFGVCAFIFGLLRERGAWMVVGLVFVALKPQAGIVVFAALLAVPVLWRYIFYAFVVTLLLCIPSFLSIGLVETTTSVIDTYLNYDGALEVNSAANTTGLRHLVEAAFGTELSSLGMSLLASLAACLIAFLLQRRAGGGGPSPDLAILIPIALIAFVALHSYDFVVAVPLAVLIFISGLPGFLRGAFALGLFLIYRSGNLAEATGFMHPETLYLPGSRIDSLAAVFMLVAFLVSVLARRGPLLQSR